ncbi:hypothetical protein B0A49_00741 [Cryomyces minteri]|uniref:Xylanolytic transcriptional activator regulatory domain-containing protein n=1 Tax=Cryomyces minteri TaxID=331657 RepID=A0A4V5NJB1_9PEZI|nr:hypothetical protein B0A49_00741 [Cryomyces minteri]
MNGTSQVQHYVSPRNHSSPASVSRQGSDGLDEKQEENWSGEESGGEEDQNGSRKRKRPMSVSCELCKQRKTVARRPNVVSQGLRAGYGRELEARLDRLEEILQTQQSTITQLASTAQKPSHHESNVFRTSPAPQQPHIPRPETALFLQKPSLFPLNNAGIPGYGNFAGPHASAMQNDDGYQQHMSNVNDGMPQRTLPGLEPSGLPPTPRDLYNHTDPPLESPSLNVQSGPSSSITIQDQELPPYDLLYALTDLFFKHINTWCPILHRRTTLDALFGPSTLDEADRVLLHAIVATTLRFSTDARLTPESRDRYHSASKQKVLLYGLENSSVKALQALVILALDLVGSSNGPPGWNLLALITRSVVQLGLAVETTSSSVSPKYPSIYTLRAMVLPESRSWIEDESRRRLFWMVYVLDRYATIATAFEFALDEKEIDRKLPCRDNLFSRNQPVETRWFKTSQREDYSMNRPENLGSFSYYIETISILSRIHQFLKKPVDIGALSDVEQWQGEYRELDNILTSWKFNLPKDISALCAYVRNNGLLTKLGPPFAFSLWVAARLLLVHGSTINQQVNPAIHSLVETLREMGRCWNVADRYATLLQRVLDEYRESEHAPAGANGERVTPSTVRILADMRRCAYDLDFLISRQPKQHVAAARLASVTPARTPGPNELEYLDVFDFFNMPRLPMPADVQGMNGMTGAESYQVLEAGTTNEFNFMVDSNTDWFMTNPS